MSNLPATVSRLTQPATIQWDSSQVELLKRTICKGSTDDEFQLFCQVAKRSGLDPFTRQIHAVKRWDAKASREVMSIQTGIDGYRLLAQRTGMYAGSDDAVFDDENKPNKATVTVYKMVQGQRCPFTATARWAEYYPGDKQGFMWNKMPCVMLSKVAEALALRKAFPAELSDMYVAEEMQRPDPAKGMIEEGNGIQKEGYVFAAHAGPKLAMKHIDSVSTEDLMGFVNAVEAKYKGKVIPAKTSEMRTAAHDEILKREGVGNEHEPDTKEGDFQY